MAVYSDLQEQYPYVCAAIDGGFIAVWQSNTELDTQDNDGFAIMMRRFDVNGSSVDFAEAYEGDYIPVGGQVGTDTDTGGDGSDDGSGDGSGGDSGGCVTTCSESDGKHLTIKISVPVCCC